MTEPTARPGLAALGSGFLQLLGSLLGLSLVVAVFWALEPGTFATWYNARLILTQTVIVGIAALGMTFVISSGGIDLSVGSIIALSSVVTALVMKHGDAGVLASVPEPLLPLVAILAGVAVGAATGAFSGSLITLLGIVPFVVTLGTMGIARGVAKVMAAESKVDAEPAWLGEMLSKSKSAAVLGLPAGLWLFLLLAVVMAVLLRSTAFGLRTMALGSNEATARLCGVPVRRTKFLLYLLAGACAGLSGAMMFARLHVGDPTSAMGLELKVIAAVVIGGASLNGGEGSILGALIGAFLMSTLANGCTLVGVPNFVQEILVGAIIVVAVGLERWRHRGA